MDVRLMAVKENGEDSHHSYICLSSDEQQSSQMLKIEHSQFTVVEITLFNSSVATLLVQAVEHGQWLQVNPNEIRLIDRRNEQLVTWSPLGKSPSQIGRASCRERV